MGSRLQFASPVTWVALFVLLAGVPLVALAWLGWRVLEQDRALEGQRVRERLENAASLMTREIDRNLATWEALLPAAAQGEAVALPPDTVLIVFDDAGVRRHQGLELPYYPRVATPLTPVASSPRFVEAERLEFRDVDLAAAAAAYRRLAASDDPAARATALVRLARVLRTQRRLDEALAVYADLALLGGTFVAGSPAAHIARLERAKLLTVLGRSEKADEEQRRLASALAHGEFPIDRATFDFLHLSVPDLPVEDASTAPRRALAKAVAHWWPQWEAQQEGRAAWSDPSRALVAVWRRGPSGTAAMAGVLSHLLASTEAIAQNLGVRVRLEDQDGHTVWGEPFADGDALTRSARETGLPWTLNVAIADAAAAQAVIRERRMVFGGGFVLVLLIITSASYVMFRSVHRELSVARLQSDFVAAVSHEFRTPLTAMCHLTEMLEEGSASSDRLPQYYQALGRESRRLHAMVENLLDFGRIDAGRREYTFEDVDAAQLVTQVVRQCEDQIPTAPSRIRWESPPIASGREFHVRADREALGLALRNLIDNALKYSPASASVTVSMTGDDAKVRIAVRDDGAGMSKDEPRAIFRKFARGSAARMMNVKGTGIGLAMADQVVRAHGGRIHLVSEAGRGSTFTIHLRSSGSFRTSRSSRTSPQGALGAAGASGVSGAAGPQGTVVPSLDHPADEKDPEDSSSSTMRTLRSWRT